MNIIKLFEEFTKTELDELIKTEKTYLRRKFKDNLFDISPYQKYLSLIQNYNISNFEYEYHTYGIYIRPDKNFLELIKKINFYLEDEISLNIEFDFSLDLKTHLIEFEYGIHEKLRGFNLGYKLYKLMIYKNIFIKSNKYSTKDAYNIWYNLMKDSELYSITSEHSSFVILKNIDDDSLKKILDNIDKENLIYDDILEEKIKDIYGSLDIYKQEK